MATNYTGDKTAAQSPSPVPAEDTSPIMHMPDDGDDLNAASVRQDFKVAADWIDWATRIGKRIFKALTLPGSTTTMSPTLQYKDYGGNVKGFVDHLGYTAFGRNIIVRENWLEPVAKSGAAGSPVSLSSFTPRWLYYATGGGASADVIAPPTDAGIITLRQPGLRIYPGGTSSNECLVYQALANFRYGPNQSAVMEFETTWSTGATNQRVYVGWVDYSNPIAGARVALYANTGGNYKLACWNSSGTETLTDTGIACDDTVHKVRLEFHGTASPYGAITARLTVDGVTVTQTGGNTPTNNTDLAIAIDSNAIGASGAGKFYLGTFTFEVNKYLGSSV